MSRLLKSQYVGASSSVPLFSVLRKYVYVKVITSSPSQEGRNFLFVFEILI